MTNSSAAAAPVPDANAQAGLKLARLVAMRLTHDLAGPIGAVATAVELIEGGDPEVTALIADGAAASVASLRLHRFILAPPGDAAPARGLLAAWVKTREGLTLDWRADPGDASRAAMLLGLAMTAAEAARRGGTLTVDDDGVSLTPPVALDVAVEAALRGEDAATPRAALAALLHAAAAARGGAITVTTGDALRLTSAHRAVEGAYQDSALPR